MGESQKFHFRADANISGASWNLFKTFRSSIDYKENKMVVHVHTSQQKYSILQGREGILEMLMNSVNPYEFCNESQLGCPSSAIFLTLR